MATYAVILPAAGKSSRFKDQNYKKVFAPLANRAVWLHSAERFLALSDVKQVLLVISPEDREFFNLKFGANVAILGIQVIEGGAERADSVQKALEQVRDDVDFVAIHDAARPCIADDWINRVFDAAEEHGAAMLAVPVPDTLKRVDKDQKITETVSREGLWAAQTPQVFRREWLVEAYAKRGKQAATDDATLVEQAGHPVYVVKGSPINFKITTKEDLRLAEHAVKAVPKPKRNNPLHPFADDDIWR